jgi:hypothetical protein
MGLKNFKGMGMETPHIHTSPLLVILWPSSSLALFLSALRLL